MRAVVKTQETYRGNFRSTGGASPVGPAIGPTVRVRRFAPVPRSSGARARRGAKVRGADRGGMLGAEDEN